MGLILASISPRRRELLKLAGFGFTIATGDFDEIVDPMMPAADLANYNALGKARAIAKELSAADDWLVIGADTIVVKNGKVFGKPADAVEACAMLAALSGQWHEVITSVAILSPRQEAVAGEKTRVKIRKLLPDEILAYVDTGEPMDKAGAYAIQGRGMLLIEAIDGCYTNVVGLPMVKLSAMLTQFGYNSCWGGRDYAGERE